MKTLINIPFTHVGKEYEIRVFYDDSIFTVIAFPIITQQMVTDTR